MRVCFSSNFLQSSWPQQLRFFVEECVRLTLKIPVRQSQPVKLTVPNKLRKCTSMKKQHEIDELAPYIMEHCLQSSISRIYDIGSGLVTIIIYLLVYYFFVIFV